MSIFFTYLVQSSFSLIALYLAYYLFFRSEAFFKLNRYFLLLTLIVAVVLPLIPYDISALTRTASVPISGVYVSDEYVRITLGEVVIKAEGDTSSILGELPIGIILLCVYFLGLFFRISKMFFGVFQLLKLIKQSEVRKMDRFKLVITKNDSPTFSFFNWIFVGNSLLRAQADLEGILAHEKIHSVQKHSWDLILAEILSVIQWFNPFTYFLKQSIRENHEYLADREVTSSFMEFDPYSNLLFQYSSKIKTNYLTHNFSYSLLKRRLKMMNKSKNPLQYSLGLLGFIAAFSLVLFACSTPSDNPQVTETNQPAIETVEDEFAVTEEMPEIETVEDVFTVVEEMPEFPGGMEALMNYLKENIKYPEQAKKDSITGKVFIQFVVEKDGSIETAKVLRGIGGGCDEEALRVIKNMPDWTPGMQRGQAVRVQYNIPIKFSLD